MSQSRNEELLNGWSHALGLLILLVGMPGLFGKALYEHQSRLTWTLIPFGLGIVMSYFSSSVYHFSPQGKNKDLWRILDHISIFFLIGGTYTPVIMMYIQRPTSVIFLGVMWVIILLGSILKFWYTGKYHNLSTALYVILGWMVILVIWPLWQNAPVKVLWWIVGGGAFYSSGVYFYKKSYKLYYHFIWHLFVLLGTVCHVIAIYLAFGG